MGKMADEPSIPNPPEDLPSDVKEALEAHAMDAHVLQETIIHAKELLNTLHKSALPIEPNKGEDILRVEDRPGYIEVVKRVEGEKDAYLYHVEQEPQPDDEEHLHWTLIGRIESDDL